ncbi:MAG: cytochrome c3 family protein [Planctomycetota bacterium]|jgi:hypothetical protein
MGRYHYVFPRWSNLLLPTVLILGALTPPYVILIVAYGFSPETTDVGYAPVQPIPYDHQLHAGELGIDCRYCHNTVEHSDHASIPPTSTCMNCHAQIQKDSPKLEPLRKSYATGESIEWVRVHDLPGYAYFSHAAHVNRGVGCVECHDRVDRMPVVYQAKALSMGWCLECHRNPEGRLRDPDLVTNLGWKFDGTDADFEKDQEMWRTVLNLNPSQDCSTCHR